LDERVTPQLHADAITQSARTTIFLSKATPGDDEFALWLAPKLEAAGYTVFADILNLEAGDRWRSIITSTLQTRAIKMLLCCRNSTLAAPGVLEEIEIASDLTKELRDPRFIIPLRLEQFKKVFGIGGLQYVDFVRGWAEGLDKLLGMLKRQKVPCEPGRVAINPNWEFYRRRGAVLLKDEPERLTSNWLRIAETPDCIHYFEPSGAIERDALAAACPNTAFPTVLIQRGIITFQSADELNSALSGVGRFVLKHAVPLVSFASEGLPAAGIQRQDASNIVHSMLRQAWNAYCRARGLLEYEYSNALGFHVDKDQAVLGQMIPWKRQGERRSSMLRNVARGHVWQYGVSAQPSLWPFPHFRLKSRVLFAPVVDEEAGPPIDDPKRQHRLRRSVCKGWRNKQWHGRLLAFIELLSGEESSIQLHLAQSAVVRVEAAPMLFTSPVSTVLPDALRDEDEESDETTLGRSVQEEEEES
jgi:hypothetical protein